MNDEMEDQELQNQVEVNQEVDGQELDNLGLEYQGLVLLKLDGAIHQIVIFSTIVKMLEKQ